MRKTRWSALAVAAWLAAGGWGVAQEAPPEVEAVVSDVSASLAGKPWIGVRLASPGEALGSQLGLTAGQGWVIEEVLADSPAAAAGLKRNDVIVSVSGEPLASVEELSGVLAEAGGEEVVIELFRGGERQSIGVTPQPAPQPMRTATAAFAIDFGFPLRGDLPEGVEVTITKSGDGPAKVRVTRGREIYDLLPDDSLERLPEDLRGPVGRFLGHDGWPHREWRLASPNGSALSIHTDGGVWNVPYVGSAGRDASRALLGLPPLQAAPQAAPADADLRKRLDDISQRLEALEKKQREKEKSK